MERGRHNHHHRLSPVLDEDEDNDDLRYLHRRPRNLSAPSAQEQQGGRAAAGSRSPSSLSDGGDSNLVMDVEPLSPGLAQGQQEWNNSYSSGGEGDRDSPPHHRRPAVVPVEDHLELANTVLNSAGPRINCHVGDDDEEEESEPQRRTPTASAQYQAGRGISSTSISCN